MFTKSNIVEFQNNYLLQSRKRGLSLKEPIYKEIFDETEK